MNIDFESRNITRRSFLKGAGVVGAAGLLSACGGSKSNNSGSTAASGVEAPKLHRCHPPQGVHFLGVCQP